MKNSISKIVRWFASGPDREVGFSEAEVKRRYSIFRWQVFLSITIGYGIFYVGRINLGVVKKPMLDEGVLTGTELGLMGSALLVAYAIGKAVNGFLADRANVSRFMPAAMLVIALANAGAGFMPCFGLLVALWALNGWAQSAGAPCSIVALANWFSFRERGTRYGIWAVSHGIGEALTFACTASVVAAVGWRGGFVVPSLLCACCGLVMFKTLLDRPTTLGLPPISAYMKDPNPAEKKIASVSALQADVLRNGAVWVLACASALIYVARYGLNHWGVLYLQEGKGHTLEVAGFIMAIYAAANIAGSFFSGIISDRFFGSRRSLPCFFAGLVQTSTLAMLHFTPPGQPVLDGAILVFSGFAMGILISFLGGLMAVDIVPPRAAGAASGVVGLFAYFGAAIQDTVSGYLVDKARNLSGPAHVDFAHLLGFWLAASLLSLLLPLTVKRRLDSTYVRQGT